MIYYSWSNSSAWSGSGEESSSPKRSELCALFLLFLMNRACKA